MEKKESYFEKLKTKAKKKYSDYTIQKKAEKDAYKTAYNKASVKRATIEGKRKGNIPKKSLIQKLQERNKKKGKNKSLDKFNVGGEKNFF